VPKLIIKRSKKVGLPPGTPVHVGEKKMDRVRIKIIDYDEAQFQEKEAKTVEECFPFKDKPTVTWINIDGIHQVDIIEKIGNHFNIHPLVLEDIVNTGQRPVELPPCLACYACPWNLNDTLLQKKKMDLIHRRSFSYLGNADRSNTINLGVV